MPNSEHEYAEQNEEQELRSLLVGVLKKPLEDMTTQLQDNMKKWLQEGLTKASNNALGAVEESLKPTTDSLDELVEAIQKLPGELKTESEAATGQLIAAISEHLKNTEQQLNITISSSFMLLQEAAEAKHQVLLRETEANINRLNNQLSESNTRSAAADSKLFIISILNLFAISLFALIYIYR